jgi:aspartyl/asparaginyl beta-hydroxylase (cupin superfamily)
LDLDPAESNCHQQCHSYVPGLTAKEWWDTTQDKEQDAWASYLSKQYKALKKEFTQVTADMEQLTVEGNNIWAGALTEDASSYGVGWKTLVLMNRGRWDPVNVNLFPVTAKAVRDSGIPAMEVFFASMQPQTSIQMHTDFTNFVLTSHLALDIPYSGENKCRLTVGDTTREWINGQVNLFDTSILHDAANDSDQTRYILMFRVWHPDLTQTERDALQFTYDCLELPGLVSSDAGERLEAEEELKIQRAFPEIKKGSSTVQGFGGGGGGAAKRPKRKPKK